MSQQLEQGDGSMQSLRTQAWSQAMHTMQSLMSDSAMTVEHEDISRHLAHASEHDKPHEQSRLILVSRPGSIVYKHAHAVHQNS